MFEVLNIGILLSFVAVVLLVLISLSISSDPVKKPKIKKGLFFLNFQNVLKRKKDKKGRKSKKG